MTDIVVFRRGVHGMPMADYAAALRDRLPDHEIVCARTPAEQRQYVADATVVTAHDIDPALLDRADDLRLFAGTYAGYDHLPLEELAERGIAVTSASGVHRSNVAEHAIGSMLAFARRLFEARRRQERTEWRAYQSSDLAGSTVTVVGLGEIGEGIVRRLDGFDVDTIGVRYTPEKGGPTDEVYGFDQIHEAVQPADYVVLICPLTDETHHLIDDAVLETMHPDAVLVNVARGQVVETDALLSVLQSNGIGGAALDVTDPEPLPPDHPLWNYENVLISPHVAGHTPEYYERLADILARNVRQAEETGRWDDLENQVR
ncbi:MAG: D-2-hydroxyacid dehydrogenase [Haloarculaceae archaeon]